MENAASHVFFFEKWKFFQKHQGVLQLVKFLLVGCFSGLVDLLVFFLCYFLVFRGLSDRAFNWRMISYTVENGGLCAFLSFAVSYGTSQTVNFFLQRKNTFRANNNTLLSGLMYALMLLGLYLFCLWFPSLISGPVYRAAGAGAGAVIVKLLSQTACAVIQFPLNKYIIMRRKQA